MAACAQETTSEERKFGSNKKTTPRMNQKWIRKTIYKKIRSKNSKNNKNQSEFAACEQKTTSEKDNFCSNTVFSLFFKIRVKKFHNAKPLAFLIHFLFPREQNHYSNLTSKIMKMCEQSIKKDSAPIQFKFFEL